MNLTDNLLTIGLTLIITHVCCLTIFRRSIVSWMGYAFGYYSALLLFANYLSTVIESLTLRLLLKLFVACCGVSVVVLYAIWL